MEINFDQIVNKFKFIYALEIYIYNTLSTLGFT